MYLTEKHYVEFPRNHDFRTLTYLEKHRLVSSRTQQGWRSAMCQTAETLVHNVIMPSCMDTVSNYTIQPTLSHSPPNKYEHRLVFNQN